MWCERLTFGFGFVCRYDFDVRMKNTTVMWMIEVLWLPFFCKILLSLDDGFTFLTAIPNDNVQLLRTKRVPGQLNFRSLLVGSCKNACSWSVGFINAIALGSPFIYAKKRD